MKFFVIGEDKSLKDVTELVLALAGGILTGNIKYSSGSYTSDAIKFVNGNNEGNAVIIGAGGATVIASGEAAGLLTPASGSAAATEKMTIGSDTDIDFYVNCQNGMTAAKKVTLSTSGLFSGHQKAITSGTSAPSGGSNGDIYIQY